MGEPTTGKEIDRETFEPQAKPGSRRLTFCPTCGRPFTRGTGVYQASRTEAKKSKDDDREPIEYCSDACVPGIPT
jgi:hypothetical protein